MTHYCDQSQCVFLQKITLTCWLTGSLCFYFIFIIFIIRAQARKAQGPIDFVRILSFFLTIWEFFWGGLNMVKNSWPNMAKA